MTEEGERNSIEGLNMILPGGFAIPHDDGRHDRRAVSAHDDGRGEVEPWSRCSFRRSRPMLMTGKILGQLMVGGLIMLVYGSVGIAGLVLATLTDVIDPMVLGSCSSLCWRTCRSRR